MTSSRQIDVGPGEDRREQMLRAALEVITERGFPDTRIADVAERAGTSPGLVIYYFKTKDQLLTEAIRYSEDSWYDAGIRQLEAIPTAAGRLEELVAMSTLPEADVAPESWVLWLELWAQAARLPAVARVREQFDDRWRRTIAELVSAGQRDGEFGDVDAEEFAITLSGLMDGFAVQIALDDPVVDPSRAFAACMRLAAAQLGFDWKPASRRRSRARSRRAAG